MLMCSKAGAKFTGSRGDPRSSKCARSLQKPELGSVWKARRSFWSNSVLCSEPLIQINSHTPHFTSWIGHIHIIHIIIYRKKSLAGIRMEAGKVRVFSTVWGDSQLGWSSARMNTAFSRLALVRDWIISLHESLKCDFSSCQRGIIRC